MKGPGERFIDYADHVVLAIPFTKLRQVTVDVFDCDPDKQAIIDTLGYGTNAKVIGGFARRPWWDDHNATGSSTTDLPLRQTWDASVGEGASGACSPTSSAASRASPRRAGSTLEWFPLAAPRFGAISPGTDAAFDGTAVRSALGRRSSGASAATPATPPEQWSFYGQEGRRVGNLHFCGEHTSLDFQGWMEGAAGERRAGGRGGDRPPRHRLSRRHEGMFAAKLLAPQACYHGDKLDPDMRPPRRRALSARLRELSPRG